MDISNERLIESLRSAARFDAEEGEYGPEQHCAWMGADRLEFLQLESHGYLSLLVRLIRGDLTKQQVQEMLILERPEEYSAALRTIQTALRINARPQDENPFRKEYEALLHKPLPDGDRL